MNAYEARQEARRARLEARADRLSREAHGRLDRANAMADCIPFGQPILVGHHSEKRDRNFRAKIRGNFEKAFELDKSARETAARAASVGTGGISSDDPDAISKLRERLAEREAAQVRMKAANTAWRKAGNKAGRQANGEWVEPPYAPFQLTNNSGNMARIRERIATLERNATRETTETTIGGARIVENAEANRLQVFFPGKPDAATRAELKSSGFRWSPTEGAWQRQISTNARWSAERICKRIEA